MTRSDCCHALSFSVQPPVGTVQDSDSTDNDPVESDAPISSVEMEGLGAWKPGLLDLRIAPFQKAHIGVYTCDLMCKLKAAGDTGF